MKRVLQTKAFARWCRISDAALREAAREIEDGLFEADLGKGVVKKRVAYAKLDTAQIELLIQHGEFKEICDDRA